MTDSAGEPPLENAIPIVYQGRQFGSRTALAEHLAPLVGKTQQTLETLLSRYQGDVERALASSRSRRPRPITFEGHVFPNRMARAKHLAPRLNRPASSVAALLMYDHDDVAAVLIAKPYRPARGS